MGDTNKGWFQGKKWAWLRNLLHLETLFVIGVIIVIIYFIFWKPTKKNTYVFNDFVKYAKENSTYTDDFIETNYGTSPPKISAPMKVKEAPPRRGFNKSEERCREIFSDIFQCEFPTVRPDFLRNPVTKRCLELDGYAPDIPTPIGVGLAFEYDGSQHSQYTPRWQSCSQEFEYQVAKDNLKDQRCKERGILLVRIPHFVSYDDLHRWILEKLKRVGMTKEVTKHLSRLKKLGKPIPKSKINVADYGI